MFDLSQKNDFSWHYISRIVCPINLFFVDGESSKPQLTEPGIHFKFHRQDQKLWPKCAVGSHCEILFHLGVNESVHKINPRHIN